MPSLIDTTLANTIFKATYSITNKPCFAGETESSSHIDPSEWFI
jgi:hypothetical protein